MSTKITCLKPRLSPTTSGRGWKPDSVRGSRHQRGYGYEWEKLRERILERDFGLCQPCKANGLVTLATQVDHIVQKANGGGDNEANLQSICAECHREKTARESNNGGRM